ncbi:MAG TPA: alpha/beta fold hydrolase [Steroidobacteraceae bacterium]|nr:alpha/beta fold hydrolase [Steroidobacteraceae bacterium]
MTRLCASALVNGLVATGLLSLAFATSAYAAPPPKTLIVGTVSLKYCNSTYDGYCGSIKRALDPSGLVKGNVNVGFEFYPRRDQSRPGIGTILPQEGGPGYSSTGSRDGYINVFEPLRTRRDILIVDKRGTGLSGAIDCPGIQTGDPNDPGALKDCANQLGLKASLYRTELAVADIVAVMNALQIADVDFYGDSYGTYVGQTFAARYPTRLRSIVLDSAYPVRASDIWFPTDWARARDGLDRVCSRSPSCRALGGKATTRAAALLNYLRHKDITGAAPDSDGTVTDTTVDVSMLFLLMTNLGNSPITYRDLDAAGRAWFDSHDATPLLRLAAEFNTPFESDAVDFSYALYQAVVCAEYPLHYDLNDPPAKRRRDYAKAIQSAREHRPNLFAPFTIDEALNSNANFTPLATCLDWPVPHPSFPQGDSLPAHPVFPAVPTLVLSGDLDSVTSVEDAAQVVDLFPDAEHIVVPNLTHVTAYTYSDVAYLPDGGDLTHCVSKVIRRFVDKLSVGDTTCIAKVRPIRTVPRFARSVDELAPAEALAGNKASPDELRLAAAALETVGDVVARFYVTYGIGTGLRGGEFTYTLQPFGQDFVLDRVKWTDDLEVSGSIRWNQNTDAITADVKLFQGGKRVGRLDIAWNDGQRDAVATLSGTVASSKVEARRIAP